MMRATMPGNVSATAKVTACHANPVFTNVTAARASFLRVGEATGERICTDAIPYVLTVRSCLNFEAPAFEFGAFVTLTEAYFEREIRCSTTSVARRHS